MYTSFDSTQRLFGAGFNSLAPLGEREGVRGWLGAAPALTTLTPTLSRQREREKQPQSVVNVA